MQCLILSQMVKVELILNSGKIFDTSIINGDDSAEIDTSNIDVGTYPFYCMVHPYMTGILTVE